MSVTSRCDTDANERGGSLSTDADPPHRYLLSGIMSCHAGIPAPHTGTLVCQRSDSLAMQPFHPMTPRCNDALKYRPNLSLSHFVIA